jgi:hypothetical protein
VHYVKSTIVNNFIYVKQISHLLAEKSLL